MFAHTQSANGPTTTLLAAKFTVVANKEEKKQSQQEAKGEKNSEDHSSQKEVVAHGSVVGQNMPRGGAVHMIGDRGAGGRGEVDTLCDGQMLCSAASGG